MADSKQDLKIIEGDPNIKFSISHEELYKKYLTKAEEDEADKKKKKDNQKSTQKERIGKVIPKNCSLSPATLVHFDPVDIAIQNPLLHPELNKKLDWEFLTENFFNLFEKVASEYVGKEYKVGFDLNGLIPQFSHLCFYDNLKRKRLEARLFKEDLDSKSENCFSFSPLNSEVSSFDFGIKLSKTPDVHYELYNANKEFNIGKICSMLIEGEVRFERDMFSKDPHADDSISGKIFGHDLWNAYEKVINKAIGGSGNSYSLKVSSHSGLEKLYVFNPTPERLEKASELITSIQEYIMQNADGLAKAIFAYGAVQKSNGTISQSIGDAALKSLPRFSKTKEFRELSY